MNTKTTLKIKYILASIITSAILTSILKNFISKEISELLIVATFSGFMTTSIDSAYERGSKQ